MDRLFIKILILLTLSFYTATPYILHAQNINVQSAIANELSVIIEPDYPRPNQTVFISLALYTADLESATISWYVNGSLKDSGRGHKKFNTLMGASGSETNIRADIEFKDGTIFSKDINLRPASVDLVWESDSYVAPFYKGRALHSYQGRVRVVAMPNFGGISPEKLVYRWSNDAQGYESQSGYGRNVFILNNSMLGVGDKINLLVTDPLTNLTAESSVTVTPREPELIFYEVSPYYGLNTDKAITPRFTMSGEELQILAAPYYK